MDAWSRDGSHEALVAGAASPWGVAGQCTYTFIYFRHFFVTASVLRRVPRARRPRRTVKPQGQHGGHHVGRAERCCGTRDGSGDNVHTCTTHASFVNSSHMPSLDRLSERPLPRSQCKSHRSQPIRPGVSTVDEFNIDEVWDYMLKPITGLQCAIFVAEHQQQLIAWVDKYVVRVMCCCPERLARSVG